MLVESSKHIVFGTNIMLIGCVHKYTLLSQYDEENSEIYQILESYSPEIIMVEIDESQDIDDCTFYSDAGSIKSYVSNSGVELYKYDLCREEYSNTEPPIIKIPKNLAEASELRKKAKNSIPDGFDKQLRKREEKGVQELINLTYDYKKIAIHCGIAHMPAYKSFLEFFSDI